MLIKKNFYLNNTLEIAPKLLGCILCRRLENGKILKGKIVETEAYTQEDPSCHAFRGITKRSATMFQKGGISYVYFTYGMYHCMNIVTEQKGRGCAVLIRALEPLSDFTGTNGPARLCKVLNITRELNGIDLTTKKSPIWIETGDIIQPEDIITTTRIGIRNAKEYPWRFYIKNNKWISKK